MNKLQVKCEIKNKIVWITTLNSVREDMADLREAISQTTVFLRNSLPSTIVFDVTSMEYADFIFPVRIVSWAKKEISLKDGNVFIKGMNESSEINYNTTKMHLIFLKYEDTIQKNA